jgi:hypothetical protein
LLTNSTVVGDAIRFVSQQSKFNDNNMQSDAQDYNENAELPKREAEEEKITNQVF